MSNRSMLDDTRGLSPENLWRLSCWLRSRGFYRAAKAIKLVNSVLHHSSLGSRAMVKKRLYLGHHGLGVVTHDNVVIGDDVIIWHNVTLAVRAPAGSDCKIVVENGVEIGANAVIIPGEGKSLRIGANSKIGAGTVVIHDIPPATTVVGAYVRMLPHASHHIRSSGVKPSKHIPREDTAS